MLESFIHIWPYLLITIPLAVLVKQTGAARMIHKVLSKKPLVSVLLATLIGALSPFCSCGVIPVISSLLIGGVPIAPVMSFWIASPSMDPEIFFLSTASIGWELSVWRLAATFGISLTAGYFTHLLAQKGLLGENILRIRKAAVQLSGIHHSNNEKVVVNCCIADDTMGVQESTMALNGENSCNCSDNCEITPASFRKKLLKETWQASAMVLKFMGIAFFINALITFYIPSDFIAGILNGNGAFSVVVATLAGIPAYTTNITALPLISGLLKLGMNPGATLAFLIAGPVTTLPAMVAVWGIASRKVFLLYLSFSIIGALLAGLLFNLLN